MNQLTRQALSAINEYKRYLPNEEFAFDCLKDSYLYLGFRQNINFIRKISSGQAKNLVECIGIDKLIDIPYMGPKKIEALLQFAKINKKPSEYWLIYYEYSEGKDRIGININIKQSPASWLNEMHKENPDILIMLKMAISITEEEYNL